MKLLSATASHGQSTRADRGPRSMSTAPQNSVQARAIVHRTRGQTHGPITRLVSPSDLGELIKPFVFLDLFRIPAGGQPLFGWHPHSGIATLTLIHEGATTYEETTGQKGVLSAGSVEWMRAGRGVWHTGTSVGGDYEGLSVVDCTAGTIGTRAVSKLLPIGRASTGGRQCSRDPRISCAGIECHCRAPGHQLSRCTAQSRRALELSAAHRT